MTKLTAEDHKLGEKWAMENGTHALLNKVVEFKPCGCKVAGAGNLKSPVRIVFCKTHASVEVDRQEKVNDLLDFLHEWFLKGQQAIHVSTLVDDVQTFDELVASCTVGRKSRKN